MSLADARATVVPIISEIEAGDAQVHETQKLLRYKKLGRAYIQTCEDMAVGADGEIDLVVLKALIDAAVLLLSNYSAAL